MDRKLVKQTVMTSVYGVTYVGAREQIKRRLKERGLDAEDSELFSASCYAAKVSDRVIDIFKCPCSLFLMFQMLYLNCKQLCGSHLPL